jgi:hypothetical protein
MRRCHDVTRSAFMYLCTILISVAVIFFHLIPRNIVMLFNPTCRDTLWLMKYDDLDFTTSSSEVDCDADRFAKEREASPGKYIRYSMTRLHECIA